MNLNWEKFIDDDGVYGVKMDGCHFVGWDLEGWCPDCETYMNLVLAAPDLLAACKLALGAFENNNAIDWNILESAIAKAEGKA